LAGAAVLHLAHPVEREAVARARAARVPRVLIDVVVAVALERVDADHDALRAEAPHELVDERGALERGRVDRDLVRAQVQHALGVGERADTARDAERNVEHLGHAVDPAAVDGTAFRARRDVVEDELVGALVAIARGERHDVAHDAVIAEPDAFDDDAAAHVQAGDYASGKNGFSSSSVIRPSSSALPETAEATSVAARACKSRASRTPPEATNAIPGQRRTQSAYSSTFGPTSAPSRSMSVQST